MSTATFRRHRAVEGTTLVELLVVLTIASVIGGIITTAVVSALNSARSTNERVDAVQEIERAQRRIAQDLRSATGLILDPDDGDLSSDLIVEFRRAGTQNQVRYRVDAPADPEQPAQLVRDSDDSGQTLVTLLNNDDGTDPLFTYLNSRGVEIDCEALDGRACLGAARIRITIVRELPNSPPVRSNTEVTIRNIRFQGA